MSRSLCVAADHPSLAGHFPGAPLVPAVLLLEAVGEAIREGGGVMRGVETAKFRRPVRPGETVSIALRPTPDPTRISFICQVGVHVVADGVVVAAPAVAP